MLQCYTRYMVITDGGTGGMDSVLVSGWITAKSLLHQMKRWVHFAGQTFCRRFRVRPTLKIVTVGMKDRLVAAMKKRWSFLAVRNSASSRVCWPPVSLMRLICVVVVDGHLM